jgi:AcrR family transcriptional regulator
MSHVAVPEGVDSRKSLRDLHAEATRTALVEAGRKLFAARGYGAVSVEDVAREARVTSGALYHHFRGKRALFDAVCEEVQRDVAEQVAAAVGGEHDPWRQLTRGCQVFLDLTMQSEVQQIVSTDAPAVLGAARRHEFDARYGLVLLNQGLADALGAKPGDRRILALGRLVLGALMEASSALVDADDAKAARRDLGAALERLLQGLR